MRADDELLRAGKACSLVWGADLAGKRRAQDFYEDLSAKDQAKFDVVFELMAATGRISNSEKFNRLGDGLFELKIFKQRITCFWSEGDLVLISGFEKKTTSDKRQAREIKTAQGLRKDYLER